ncbi:TPA: hypothetical protein R6P87_002892 [Klebsiella pneumoniae]|uniref:hypothetical protein n=1 Tax=Klebsiella pneumoniae TaxID=573 RepID=UPI00067A9C76|nr:hypothetical protein [Klebsiella pneumoniae]EKW3991362.1 hypothetical protein [Klebsiella pneumoniae]MDT8241328.1 hypothetical protein [Klebsiella pneumoniae]OVF86933.1 hypothetical protein B5L83_06505 [Klebsiella pneumoniae]HCI4285500.1 hypothetical protein [Klebsiella pneumoniae]HCI7044883.1 hypothetical protein [Klebsiella pneumoniae]
MMSLWDALRMNMMISYQELVRTFPNKMDCTEIEALSSLLRVLTGDVCAWLIEEQAVKNNK